MTDKMMREYKLNVIFIIALKLTVIFLIVLKLTGVIH